MKILTLILILFTLSATVAEAQLSYGSELTGIVMIPTSSFSDAFKPGFGGTIGMFFDMRDNLRVTLSGGYLTSPVKESGVQQIYNEAGGTGTIEPSGSVKTIPLLLGLWLITPGTVRFYGGLEAGIYIYSVKVDARITDNTGSANVQLADDTRSEFGINLGFGGILPVKDNISATAGVRYHFVQTSEFRSTTGGSSGVTLSTNQFLTFALGLNWAFSSDN